MKLLRNEQGVALITVLLFSMVAFGVVTGAYFMVTSHSKLSGMEKRYVSELETARGVASYVIGEIKNGSLTCGANNCCPAPPCQAGLNNATGLCQANKTIDIHGAICAALNRTPTATGCTNITACLMSQTDYTEINPGASAPDNAVQVSVFTVNVQAKSNSGEKANIDFVLRM